MRALRRVLPVKTRRAHSTAICGRVAQMPCFERARCVVGYVAMAGEVDPAPILGQALATGKSVGLPRVVAADDALVLHRWAVGEPLVRSDFGVEEPLAGAPVISASDVDLILVPALAIDSHGNRIGYGKGFYDRLLAGLPNACSIGITYDFQLIGEIPQTPGDVPVALVVTERRTLKPEGTS